MFNYLGFFVIIYLIIMAFLYALIKRSGVPFTIPGDIYIHKGDTKIYIPLATAFLISIVIFIISFRFIPKGKTNINDLINNTTTVNDEF